MNLLKEAPSVLQALLVRGAIRLVLALPYRWALSIGRVLGLFTWAVLPTRRRLVEVQARSAIGEEATRSFVLKVFMNQGEILVDTIRYAFMDEDELRSRIRIEGRENLEEALEQGRGVMMITGHIGNWEILSNLPRLVGIQFCVMADRREDERLEAAIDGIRRRSGATILPPKGKALMLVKELRKGRLIGMVVDQRGRRRDNLFCDVFGMPAPTNPAPAFIAIKGDALVLPVYAMKEEGGYVIRFDPLVDTRRFSPGADGIEALSRFMQTWVSTTVRKNPTWWFWLHSRWIKRKTFRSLARSGGDFKALVRSMNRPVTRE